MYYEYYNTDLSATWMARGVFRHHMTYLPMYVDLSAAESCLQSCKRCLCIGSRRPLKTLLHWRLGAVPKFATDNRINVVDLFDDPHFSIIQRSVCSLSRFFNEAASCANHKKLETLQNALNLGTVTQRKIRRKFSTTLSWSKNNHNVAISSWYFVNVCHKDLRYHVS